MDAKILGNYIAARRKELGMTQANLAEKIHVTKQYPAGSVVLDCRISII